MSRAATTADAFNAVGEPSRREILNYLVLQEQAVGEIVSTLRLGQPSVSKHLRVLRDVGLVHVRRDGRRMMYRTNAEAISPCMNGPALSSVTGSSSCLASKKGPKPSNTGK